MCEPMCNPASAMHLVAGVGFRISSYALSPAASPKGSRLRLRPNDQKESTLATQAADEWGGGRGVGGSGHGYGYDRLRHFRLECPLLCSSCLNNEIVGLDLTASLNSKMLQATMQHPTETKPRLHNQKVTENVARRVMVAQKLAAAETKNKIM